MRLSYEKNLQTYKLNDELNSLYKYASLYDVHKFGKSEKTTLKINVSCTQNCKQLRHLFYRVSKRDSEK